MSPVEEAILIAAEVLIKPFEGYARKLADGGCKAYPDPASGGEPWTIGFGSTGPNIGPDTVWTRQQAETALELHILYFISKLLILSPNLINATPRQIAAIISFAYNCGLGNYRISTLKKRIDSENWEGAAKEILKWNKARGRVLPGLTRRRTAEAALLTT
jgi:GH24 family phage-related lysozyme (muramidase)